MEKPSDRFRMLETRFLAHCEEFNVDWGNVMCTTARLFEKLGYILQTPIED